MMYKPSDKILAISEEVDRWMYIDMNDYTPKLRPDAPADIVKKRQMIMDDYARHTMAGCG